VLRINSVSLWLVENPRNRSCQDNTGLSYRKESIQRRNGSDSRETRKAMKKLREEKEEGL
jgi:hypothetical protein